MHRVDELHVADSALHLADHACDAFVAFAAEADGPFDRGSLPRPALPVATDLRQIVGEDVRSTAAVRTVNDHDRLVREVDSWVRAGDGFVIPGSDLAEEYASDCFGSELHFPGNAGNVIGGDDGPQNSRDVQNLDLRLAQLLVGHWAVASTEVNGAGQHLADSAAAADRLIVDLNLGVGLVILAKPLGIHRIRKSCARPV